VSDSTPRQGGRLIQFPASDEPRREPVAAGRQDEPELAELGVGIGVHELRDVVASFVGLLDSFELYVRQVRALAVLALTGEPLDRASLEAIVENSDRDAERVAEIRINYGRLQAMLDEAIRGEGR
jgi:hypothetical protein